MGLFSNRLDRESLKPGDHIYSWRAAYLYAHHGIYVGDEKVIHFTRTGQKTGTSSVVDVLMVSSAPPPYLIPCPNCPPTNNTNGVIASCLDCFLAGGVLYRYEYSTNAAIFLAKPLDATCTLGASEPPETVVFRANYLLENGFGCYDIFKNNCQDFAIYCKTSLLISDKKSMTPQNAHAASTIWKSVTGLFSNRLDRESLKPGDHIYSWRAAYIYAHHGIYVSDEKVIHFTRTGQNTGTSSVVDVLMVSSMPEPSLIQCTNCPPTNNTSGVIASCLDCFLAGGVLSRYEYSTNAAILLAKPREATCTLAPSDPPGDVIYRANYLLDLEKGFGCYNVFKNNCQDFAIYCKTGLLVSDKKSMTPQNAHAASFIWKSVTGLLVSDKKSISQSGHVASIFGKTLTGVVSGMLKFANTNIYAKTAVSVGSGVVTHFVSRYSYDIGIRSDVIKVPVEEVVRTLHNKVN